MRFPDYPLIDSEYQLPALLVLTAVDKILAFRIESVGYAIEVSDGITIRCPEDVGLIFCVKTLKQPLGCYDNNYYR